MRRSLTLFSLTALLAGSAFAGAEFHLSGRAGLIGTPGFTEGIDELFTVTESGWLAGYASSTRGERAAWVMNPADGITRRMGVIPGEDAGRDSLHQLGEVTESGWVLGESYVNRPDGINYHLPWIAEGATGRTIRLGLTGPGFGFSPRLQKMTESGFACGETRRHREGWPKGDAVWALDCRAGVSVRVGFFNDAIHTRHDPDSVDDGEQESEAHILTESGWLGGWSRRYPDASRGLTAWVAHAATGVTRRMGWRAQDHTRDYSAIMGISEDGRVTGTSSGTFAGGYSGTVCWVADAATGATRRIGLWEGAGFTHPTEPAQVSYISLLTRAGWVAGVSYLYDQDGREYGQAQWVADGRAAVTRRVGLWRTPGFTEGGRGEVRFLTESGWAGGNFDGRGSAVWVAEAVTGATRRMGLTGEEYTGLNGERQSEITGITESGWVSGWSLTYRGADGAPSRTPAGGVVWVAEAATGVTRTVGLAGAEFTGSSGERAGSIERVTEDGKVYGYSLRYRGGESAGTAAWVADAATGNTVRLGLTGAEFTRSGNNWQETKFLKWTESGLVHGYSVRQAAPDGVQRDVPWITDTRAGQTWTPGIGAGLHQILSMTESGLVAGSTETSRPPFWQPVYAAWVLDTRSGIQHRLNPGPPPPPGKDGGSGISRITPVGLVRGGYRHWLNDQAYEARPFLWSLEMGTLLFPEAREDNPGGGDATLGSLRINTRGLIAGGFRLPTSGGQGLFYGEARLVESPDSPVRVTGLERTPGGKFRLSFSTDAAVNITLQSSADLTTWADGQTMDAPAGASHIEIEPDPAAGQNRYWRLKTAP